MERIVFHLRDTIVRVENSSLDLQVLHLQENILLLLQVQGGITEHLHLLTRTTQGFLSTETGYLVRELLSKRSQD